MSDELRAADLDTVRGQLGREPTTPFSVVARCTGGHPLVIRNRPLDADGHPFPTTYWLTCVDAVKAVSRVESEGWIARLAEDPTIAEGVQIAHRSYAAERGEMVPGAEEWGGVGGTRRGIKCLHAHYAYHLAGGDDVVGRWTAAQVEPIHGGEPAGRVAAIDQGTNSTRLLVLEPRGSGEDPLELARDMRHHAARQRRGSRRPARSGVDRANARRDRPVRASGPRTACRAHPARGDQRRARRLEQGGAPRSHPRTDRRRARTDRRGAGGRAVVPRGDAGPGPRDRPVPLDRRRWWIDGVRRGSAAHGRRSVDLHADGECPAHRAGAAIGPTVGRRSPGVRGSDRAPSRRGGAGRARGGRSHMRRRGGDGDHSPSVRARARAVRPGCDPPIHPHARRTPNGPSRSLPR